MSGRPLIEKREPAPSPLGRWYLAFLGRLTPMQRKLWLEHGHAAIFMAGFAMFFAAFVFAYSNGNVYALSLTLWAAPVGAALALIIGMEFEGWMKAVHTLPVSRREIQDAFWCIYVIAVPLAYSFIATVMLVFAAQSAHAPWPWYRVIELPVFYCGLHAALFVCVAGGQKFDACLVVLVGIVALPFVFNARSLLPDVWLPYPPLSFGAIALSYRWRHLVFRFDPADFQRATNDDEDPELEELLKDESDPDVVEMMRGDSISFSQINSAVWESPHPFRAMILQRAQQALVTPLFICAIIAVFCWLFGITFEATAFPSGVAILLCSFSAASKAW